MADDENPNLLLAARRATARAIDRYLEPALGTVFESLAGTLSILVRGLVVIGLLVFIQLVTGIGWPQLLAGGGGTLGIGFLTRHLLNRKRTSPVTEVKTPAADRIGQVRRGIEWT